LLSSAFKQNEKVVIERMPPDINRRVPNTSYERHSRAVNTFE
jgi:hypothetical protein